MIDSFREVISLCVGILKLEVTAPQMGTLSLWGALIFGLVASVLLVLILMFLKE